eukprot:8800893-Pyramimonas_sp.AAC.1
MAPRRLSRALRPITSLSAENRGKMTEELRSHVHSAQGERGRGRRTAEGGRRRAARAPSALLLSPASRGRLARAV